MEKDKSKDQVEDFKDLKKSSIDQVEESKI
jgi:hypothetical protein